ncbi:MAG TPA: hypothetical protein VMT99_01115 [Candidatus Paceibacterota bacterium]|nr:hypothetical protein [Candidatus Paceibacterota bacterium]
MTLRRILLTIVVFDLVLATIAYFVVFYNTPGTYEVATSPLPTTSLALSSSTASSTNLIPSSTASSTASSSPEASSTTPESTSTPVGNPAGSVYGSEFAPPYPLTWTEGGASLSIVGAVLQGNALTFQLAVAMGDAAQCVPMNLRMLADEQGDLISPATQQFTFPESGSCEGAPGATYTDQKVTFNINPTLASLFFTTGGTSNIFFRVATTTDGGVSISLPQQNG